MDGFLKASVPVDKLKGFRNNVVLRNRLDSNQRPSQITTFP